MPHLNIFLFQSLWLSRHKRENYRQFAISFVRDYIHAMFTSEKHGMRVLGRTDLWARNAFWNLECHFLTTLIVCNCVFDVSRMINSVVKVCFFDWKKSLYFHFFSNCFPIDFLKHVTRKNSNNNFVAINISHLLTNKTTKAT